ncbi:MAG: glutamine synthetase III [Bacteroidales bacterium]
MAIFRRSALERFSTGKGERFFYDPRPISQLFGENVFDMAKMEHYLTPESFAALQSNIANGGKIDREQAEQIAEGMKRWALEKEATHYTHWFHPLTDATAEKHEAFVEFNGKGVVEHFCGEALVRQEPDASSLPSGGLRNTFEARGYSTWDPSSPAFIIDGTLFIPSLFVSYTGDSLDMKTPHLRSLDCVEKGALKLAKLFDPEVESCSVMLGIEQEYFVVDEALYRARPDLMLCNRTVVGKMAAKEQQLEDHYFGVIPSKVMAFMKDFESEAYKLGVLLKTRHNEVAPNQFEFAPFYEKANLAIDHNLMMMILMRKIAKRHKLKVIFHEKPFAGVNGSGKHCNWSILTQKGNNLFSPGESFEDNLRFLSFFSAVVRGLYQHNHLLMAGCASLANSFRLGGGEAPPAMGSLFIGKRLTQVIDSIGSGNFFKKMVGNEKSGLKLSDKSLEILIDNADRNRTAPFAFTGNRFEFRAVGSSLNPSFVLSILNSAVAQQITRFGTIVDEAMERGVERDKALLETIALFIEEARPLLFEGNCYSKEWATEAASRGLRSINNSPEAFKALIEEGSVKLFGESGVLNFKELEARYLQLNETYTKKIEIEAKVLIDLATNHVIPAAVKYQNRLIENVRGLRELYGEQEGSSLSHYQSDSLKKISNAIQSIGTGVKAASKIVGRGVESSSLSKKGELYFKDLLPLLASIRESVDTLEMLIDDQLWPLPKYRELLFWR